MTLEVGNGTNSFFLRKKDSTSGNLSITHYTLYAAQAQNKCDHWKSFQENVSITASGSLIHVRIHQQEIPIGDHGQKKASMREFIT